MTDDPEATASPATEIARAAAARLSGSLGDELPAEVELELEHAAGMPRAYADPVSIAGLIVAIASLAWNIYVQLHRSRLELADAVRQHWAEEHAVDPTMQSVIDAVAEETVKHGER